MPTAHPRQHVPALDGIRGFAVIAVIFCHCGLLANGGFGVDMFFTLSGYLITGILLDERERYGRVSFLNFYARRFLRLAPALWLLVALYIPASKLLHLHVNGAVQDSAMALTYISNWTRAFLNRPDYLGHTWSLSVEEQFYLLWPPLVLLLYKLLGRRWSAASLCLLGVALIAAWRIFLRAHGATDQRLYNGLDTCSDPLLLGAALAFFLPKLPSTLAALAAAVTLLLLLVFFSGLLGDSHLTAGLLTLILMLAILNAPAAWTTRLLALKPLAWIGKISYGLYLFHFPITAYLSNQHWFPRDIALFAFPAAFLLATLSYYAVERPCLRLKDRFRPSPERGREGAVAVEPTPLTESPHAAGNQVHARQP